MDVGDLPYEQPFMICLERKDRREGLTVLVFCVWMAVR